MQRASELSDVSLGIPKWIHAPMEVCIHEAELCASGEDKSQSAADSQAKRNLISVFATEFQPMDQGSTDVSRSLPWYSSVLRDAQLSVKERTDLLADEIQIKQRYQKDGLFYSFASLDKQKTSEIIGPRIDELEINLRNLWVIKQRLTIKKIAVADLERGKLNELYSLVAERPRQQFVSHAKISEWMASLPHTSPVTLKIGQAPAWLAEKMREILLNAGYIISKGKGPILVMNVETLREPSGTDDEKYTFTMHVSVQRNDSDQRAISTVKTVRGKSQGDAVEKVKVVFQKYVEDHLVDLQLDGDES
jgi:hypothetical protein